jgi:hypothetical protein
MRHYVIGTKARPARLSLDFGQRSVPRASRARHRHLIPAPLRIMPPESGAMILRQPRGKERTRRPPFPLSNHLAAVLAVKGPLRRSAPLTAPGHREKAT